MVEIENVEQESMPKPASRENDWPTILLYLYVHVFSVVGLVFLIDAALYTLLFGVILVVLGFLGTTAGAHRLWTHRTYKADLKLRICLMLCQTLAGEGSIYTWVLLHRLHHKRFGTSRDPFNANKGFLHAHVISKTTKPVGGYDTLKSEVDMSDIEGDAVVMFQKKYYLIMYLVLTLLLCINAPLEYWDDTIYSAFFGIGVIRLCIVMNLSWLISSAVALWGLDTEGLSLQGKNLTEVIEKQNWLTYHYIAPWDYQTSEYGGYSNDVTSKFIRLCKSLGMASNLKTMDGTTIGKAIQASSETGKPISECLLQVHGFEDNVPENDAH